MDINESTSRARSGKPPEWFGWVIGLVAVGWVVASVCLFGSILEYSLLLFGEQMTPYEESMADHYTRIWAVVTAVGPFAIALLSWCLRYWRTGWVFAVIGVVLGLLLASQEWVQAVFKPYV